MMPRGFKKFGEQNKISPDTPEEERWINNSIIMMEFPGVSLKDLEELSINEYQAYLNIAKGIQQKREEESKETQN